MKRPWGERKGEREGRGERAGGRGKRREREGRGERAGGRGKKEKEGGERREREQEEREEGKRRGPMKFDFYMTFLFQMAHTHTHMYVSRHRWWHKRGRSNTKANTLASLSSTQRGGQLYTPTGRQEATNALPDAENTPATSVPRRKEGT